MQEALSSAGKVVPSFLSSVYSTFLIVPASSAFRPAWMARGRSSGTMNSSAVLPIISSALEQPCRATACWLTMMMLLFKSVIVIASGEVSTKLR